MQLDFSQQDVGQTAPLADCVTLELLQMRNETQRLKQVIQQKYHEYNAKTCQLNEQVLSLK